MRTSNQANFLTLNFTEINMNTAKIIEEIIEEISEECEHLCQYIEKALELAEMEIESIMENSKDMELNKRIIKTCVMTYCYKVKNEN
jgi:hypothetical protein